MDRREFLFSSLVFTEFRMNDAQFGNGPIYTGYGSTMSDAGEVGLRLINADRYQITDRHFKNIAGTAIDLQSSAGGWQHVGRLHGVSARDCYRGFHFHNAAEYETVSDCWADNCVFGYLVESGNNNFVNCKARYCSTGVRIGAGTNHAHGTWVGLISHHNTYNLSCEGVALGEHFLGCQFISSQSPGDATPANRLGGIQLINSKGIALTGGQIAFSDITVDANSQLSLNHVILRDVVNVTVAPGGIFKSYNPVVVSGATLTLNGVSWNGIN